MKKILKELQDFDKSILKTMKSGIHFSFILCIFSTLILAVYHSLHIQNLFYVGISLFKTSLFFFVAFITYGFVFNHIKC